MKTFNQEIAFATLTARAKKVNKLVGFELVKVGLYDGKTEFKLDSAYFPHSTTIRNRDRYDSILEVMNRVEWVVRNTPRKLYPAIGDIINRYSDPYRGLGTDQFSPERTTRGVKIYRADGTVESPTILKKVHTYVAKRM